jgi:hypothetical protein
MTPGSAFMTIPEAIAAAADGDQIQVATGGYAPFDFGTRLVRVFGNPQSPQRPTISGGFAQTCVTFSGGVADIQMLENFVLRQGNAAMGGGIRINGGEPVVRNVDVLSCIAQTGGGIWASASKPVFIDCEIIANTANQGDLQREGGGIFLVDSGACFIDCRIWANQADPDDNDVSGHGGGVFVSGDHADGTGSRFEDCAIGANIAANGGGAYLENETTVTFERCDFQNNRATSGSDNFTDGNGGGVFVTRSCPTFESCAFRNNTAWVVQGVIGVQSAGAGGGLYFEDAINGIPLAPCGGSLLSNCTVIYNNAGHQLNGFGGGLYIESAPVAVERSIVWHNTAELTMAGDSQGPQIAIFNIPQIPGALVTGETIALQRPGLIFQSPGQGYFSFQQINISNPQLGSNMSYRLESTSPMIDALPPGYVPQIGMQDLEGEPRFVGSTVDLGADEFMDCDSLTEYGDANFNSTGARTRLIGLGSQSIAVNSFTLSVSSAPPNVFGLLIYGPNQISVPLGSGIQFVGGGFVRIAPALPTNGMGEAIRTLDLSSLSQSPFNPIDDGSNWNFQYWHRDVDGMGVATSNLSNGLNAYFCE